jgi:hypothetical protein
MQGGCECIWDIHKSCHYDRVGAGELFVQQRLDKVLDHVVVGEENTYSFADSGLLDELSLKVGALNT